MSDPITSLCAQYRRGEITGDQFREAFAAIVGEVDDTYAATGDPPGLVDGD